jgi:NADPH-dependent glutamate synthase beta subunit-like oxidoreductase
MSLPLKSACIEKMGVTIRPTRHLVPRITLETLRHEGFGVFMAVGLHGGRRLELKTKMLTGSPGVDFLRDAAMGKTVDIGENVLVIGGGNVAVDVALTAKRKGAAKVTMICLEKRDEMPAWEHEIQDALDEDIKIVNSFGPKSFFVDKARQGIRLEFKSARRSLMMKAGFPQL